MLTHSKQEWVSLEGSVGYARIFYAKIALMRERDGGICVLVRCAAHHGYSELVLFNLVLQ